MESGSEYQTLSNPYEHSIKGTCHTKYILLAACRFVVNTNKTLDMVSSILVTKSGTAQEFL